MFLLLAINIFVNLIYPSDNVVPSRYSKFMTAESLYINNDLFMAEKLYKEVLKEQSDDTAFNSMARLISIAEKNGDRSLFKDMLLSFKVINKSKSEVYSELLYTIGKYLLQSDDYKRSVDFLSSIDRKSQFYPKALYVKASSLVGLKKYPEALFVFETIIRTKSKHVTKDIKDAAVLGKARVFVLVKKYDEALSEYQKVDDLSPYYLKSLEETARLFISKKETEQALSHIEALVLINRDLYVKDHVKSTTGSDGYSDIDLMKLMLLQAYIYIDKEKLEDATDVLDEVLLSYDRIKKDFTEELSRFKLSEDLTQVISHPYKDGKPRSLLTNPEFEIFGNNEKYSRAFREWLPEKDKKYFLRNLIVYYSLLNRARVIEQKRETEILSNEDVRLIELKNAMNTELKGYIKSLIDKMNFKLDEIGLKAQLGKIDIIWNAKENQSKKIKEMQEKRQEDSGDTGDKDNNILE
jgi:tetratricopeptide (TPR) repeat protein